MHRLFVARLQSHRPAKQPWSPRYTMERALVNILETTSSFSFKAAALLEGKPFTWQESLNPGTSANFGTAGAVRIAAPGAAAGTAAAAAGAGAGLGVRAAAAAGRQARQQRGGRGGRSSSSRQRPDVSDSVGSMSPASAASIGDVAGGASSSHSAAAASRLSAASRGSAQQQQQQQAWLPAGERQMQKEPSFRAGVLPAAGAGGSNSNSGSSGRLTTKAPRHQRSRSLSSIQSGDGGSLRDGDDEDTAPAELPQQQQRQEELSVPSIPPVTSPFARVSHMQQHGAALERCGFGSTISLHVGTPPSSHRWNQQQHRLWQQAQMQTQAQAQAHAAEANSTSSRGQGGPGSGGSPATTATPMSAVGAGASFPGAAAAAGSTSAAGAAGGAGTAAAGVSKVVAAAVQPPFLDMVPWYSGTSADLFKTMFDLLISVKLFLGRFDMRTMQVGGAGVVIFGAVGYGGAGQGCASRLRLP